MNSRMSSATILLVEDSPTDADLTKHALRSGKICNHLDHVTDGVEAMRYLRREGPYANCKRPDLVLLDLNLPKKSGLEVLREIREDPLLHSQFVVILTASHEERDVIEAYGLNANAYITKPVDFIQFTDVVKQIDLFYFQIVTLPPSEP